MKKFTFILIILILLIITFSCKTASVPESEDLTQYVDPMIGTAHCRWFHVAPGSNPFGMAKPGPSTDGHLGNLTGWEAVGYDFRHTSIEGFPNFHEFQVGGVVFMPTTGELKTIPGKPDSNGEGYRSSFDKKDEVLKPGYYSVILKDYNIKAEVTSTDRVSFHRYTFPAGEKSHILFDIGNKQGESGEVKDARVTYMPDGRIEGFVETYPEYVKKYQTGASVKMYFSADIDRKPESYGIFNKTVSESGKNEATGQGAGLYHALKGRGLASDINGAYPKNDGTVGQIPPGADNKPQFKFYNTDGIWGGQWNLIQLWALVYPEYLTGFINTHLTVYNDAGWLGDGIANSKYVSGVGTNQVPLAIVAAYMCGIRDFDIQKGYEASLKNEITSEGRVFGAGKMDVEKFVKYGYVPYMEKGEGSDELWRFACSHTLEYSYTSWEGMNSIPGSTAFS